MLTVRLSRRRLAGIITGMLASSALAHADESSTLPAQVAPIRVHELRCEYRVDPLGIETLTPRFSWQIDDPAATRGQRQTAYRVRVSSRVNALSTGDRWDSGRVASDQSVGIIYAGHKLKAGDICFWEVMVWDRNGAASAWSAPARFAVGLLEPADWSAAWIGMASASGGECPWFRKTFSLDSLPETALAFIGSIGFHELYVNGKQVGDRVLNPSVSDLRKRALYVTYDIHECLQPGENVIALWAAPGWSPFTDANPPVTFDVAKSPLCIAQIQLETSESGFTKATRTHIVSDASWRCALSTTRHLGHWHNSDFGGDFVDARKEIAGWNNVGFDHGAWEATALYQPGRVVSSDTADPNRRCETINAAAIEPLAPGSWRVTMSEIFTGWLELHVEGAPGTQITVKTSSRADHAVEFNQVDQYIIGNSGVGVFSPRFSYHQYHFVTIDGLEQAPTHQHIVGYRIGNDLKRIGAFDCSNPLLKAIYDATIRTYVNLTTGGMTVDCPHRERLGYGGDGHTSLELSLDNFDSNAFFAKWARDWCDVQLPNGDIYHTAPTMGGGGGPSWGGFAITMPYEVYVAHGDRRILEATYDTGRHWLGFLGSHVGDAGLLTPLTGDTSFSGDNRWYFLGDWAAPHRNEESSSPEALLFNNCYYVYVLDMSAKIAGVLGKTTDQSEYRERAAKVRQAIEKRFYDPKAKAYLDARETHCIMPLVAGVPEGDRIAELLATFEHELRVTRGGHLDTGLQGTYFMTKYLTEHERSDLILAYATQTTAPSYGDLLAKGYTTWPEYWTGADSKTHGCLNGIGGWFQRGLAGIRPDPAAPGYRRVIVQPAIVGDLTWSAAYHDGPYGRIAVRWEREASGCLTLNVTIPPNSTGEVHVPHAASARVTESGVDAGEAKAIRFARAERGGSVFEVGAGVYRFVVGYRQKAL